MLSICLWLTIARSGTISADSLSVKKQESKSGGIWVATDKQNIVRWTRPFRNSYVQAIPTLDKKAFLVPTPRGMECVLPQGKTLWSIPFFEPSEPDFALCTTDRVIVGIGFGTSSHDRSEDATRFRARSYSLSDGKLRWDKSLQEIGRPIAALEQGEFVTLPEPEFGNKRVSVRRGNGAVAQSWRIQKMDMDALFSTNAAYQTWTVRREKSGLRLRVVSAGDFTEKVKFVSEIWLKKGESVCVLHWHKV